jgi:sporulation-control protein spo0M
MSFLDKVKAATGMGNATLEVDISQRPTKRGEELVATIRVVPGKTIQKLNFVVITVEYEGEFQMKNADGNMIRIVGKGYVLHDKPANTLNTNLQPGQTIELPVRVKIPSDSPLTTEGVKYKFYTRADIEGAGDPEHTTPLEIRG